MRISVITAFPELFPGPLSASVTGRSLKDGLWSLEAINLRHYAVDGRIDDPPIGGGGGMILRADVASAALDSASAPQAFCLSPRGRVLTQSKLHELTRLEHFALLCPRFEGIDQRVLDHHQIEEISIGNYVLTCGEIAAYILIDGCVRLLPGVLGNAASSQEESFAIDSPYENLVEYPQYTKPNVWRDAQAPEILFSGDHGKIAKWRLDQAKALTQKMRPDLAM